MRRAAAHGIECQHGAETLPNGVVSSDSGSGATVKQGRNALRDTRLPVLPGDAAILA